MTDAADVERQLPYTAEEITKGIANAIEARDFPAAVSLLKMLAVRDPHRAEVVYESMMAVLDMLRRQDG